MGYMFCWSQPKTRNVTKGDQRRSFERYKYFAFQDTVTFTFDPLTSKSIESSCPIRPIILWGWNDVGETELQFLNENNFGILCHGNIDLWPTHLKSETAILLTKSNSPMKFEVCC